MKLIILLALALLILGAVYYKQQVSEQLYTDNMLYSSYLNSDIVGKVNSLSTTWVAGYNRRWDGMTKE